MCIIIVQSHVNVSQAKIHANTTTFLYSIYGFYITLKRFKPNLALDSVFLCYRALNGCHVMVIVLLVYDNYMSAMVGQDDNIN